MSLARNYGNDTNKIHGRIHGSQVLVVLHFAVLVFQRSVQIYGYKEIKG